MSDSAAIVGARIFQLTVDAHDAERLAEFWSITLGRAVEHLGSGVVSLAADAAGTRLTFSPSTDPKQTKNRLHLDLATDDRHRAVEELVERGATVIAEHSAWTVMADPDGNEFCVT